MREYNSLEMPSGLRVDGAAGFFGWDGPGVPGRESMLRTSAAVAAMVKEGEVTCRERLPAVLLYLVQY
jgi:hypothetical protein